MTETLNLYAYRTLVTLRTLSSARNPRELMNYIRGGLVELKSLLGR